MPAKPIPDRYQVVTPYLIVRGAAKAIDFYKQAFGAEEEMRMAGPDGRIGHAEIRVGGAVLMLADEAPGMGHHSPTALGGTTVGILVYVPNVDEVFGRAVAAGAQVMRPLENQFYGDRSGTLIDPFGHKWTIATHVEDVPPEEMQRRLATMMPPAAG